MKPPSIPRKPAPFLTVALALACIVQASAAAEPAVAPLAIHPDNPRYLLFRGMSESHLDAIEQVLAHHGLAVALECSDGAWLLAGAVGDRERAAFREALRLGRVDAATLAEALGASPEEAAEWLDALARHRLVLRCDDGWIAVPRAS